MMYIELCYLCMIKVIYDIGGLVCVVDLLNIM